MTLNELTIRVYRRLAGESQEDPSASDSEVIKESYAAVYDSLLSDGLVSWGPLASDDEDDSIPEGLIIALGGLIYEDCKRLYGGGDPDPERNKLHKKSISRYLANPFDGSPTITEYF